MTQDLAKIILDETGIESRITILGHIQRGGSPTARDRVTASRMGEYAIKLIMEGKRNRIVAMKAGDLVDFDTMEALEMKKGLQESLYLTSQVLTTQ